MRVFRPRRAAKRQGCCDSKRERRGDEKGKSILGKGTGEQDGEGILHSLPLSLSIISTATRWFFLPNCYYDILSNNEVMNWSI